MTIVSARPLAQLIPDARFIELSGSYARPQTQEAELILDEVVSLRHGGLRAPPVATAIMINVLPSQPASTGEAHLDG